MPIRVERQVVEYLSTLSKQADWVNRTIEELNRDQKECVRPLEQEAIRLKTSLNGLEREIDRLVRGVGQGTVSVQRLEQEMHRQHKEQQGLEAHIKRCSDSPRGNTMRRSFYEI
jgi:chromosome segregation ATPase